MGRRGAAAGRVIIDREHLGNSSFADFIEPHASSPLVVADTTFPEMRRFRGKLEGAFGWRFGRFGLGLAAGFEVRDHRTENARLPRIGKMSSQGVAFGVMRELSSSLRFAAHARWLGSDEQISLIGQPGTGLVYQFDGYSEPTQIGVVPPQILYVRQVDRNAWAFRLAASGELGGAAWTAYWGLTTADEGHFTEQRANPAKDRWEADGSAFGVAVQRALFGNRLSLTAEARYSELEGDAMRFGLDGVVFRADEDLFYGSADLRYSASGWALGGVLSLTHEERLRRDFIAETRSEIESWLPAIGFEVARSLGAGTSASLGFSFSDYSARSQIPDPDLMGPVYQRVIAPELSLYATQTTPSSLSVALRHETGQASGLYVRLRRETASAGDASSPVPLAPTGDRTLWHVTVGLVFGQ